MEAEHPEIPAKLRAHVIWAGIHFALRLQIHQNQLCVIILPPQQAIKAAGNAALHITQPVFTGNGLIGLPNGMFQQRFHPFAVFRRIFASVTSRQEILQRFVYRLPPRLPNMLRLHNPFHRPRILLALANLRH